MTQYTNIGALPISMQVFLATDHYDHNSDPNTVSVTSLIKPIRQKVLGSRVSSKDGMVDLVAMVPSRVGTAIHDGIERAWTGDYKATLKLLGYPEKFINSIVINKPIDEVTEDEHPIYFEQRLSKQVGDMTVTGKFDFIADGTVEDFKTTSTYSAMNGNNDEKYILQGSIYRWLNPKMITAPLMAIQFIFTDWSGAKAAADPSYPQQRTMRKQFSLKPINETDNYVRTKLAEMAQYMDAEEHLLPLCSDSDLWRSEPVYKYYKDPTKTLRSTKNFSDKQAAHIHAASLGVGVVIEKPGQVTACKYCPGFTLCTQKDTLIANGELVL